MANGGIIGTVNNPTSSTATGVWQQEEQYEAVRNGTWPLRPLFTTKSLRFNDGSSDKLTRTQSNGNRQKFTLSTWLKRSALNTTSPNIIKAGANDGTRNMLRFEGTNQLRFYGVDASVGSGASIDIKTNRVFTDPSAWYHIVVAVDTTQGTASNRIKIYVNGVQETSFASNTIPNQNTNTQFNLNGIVMAIGASSFGSSEYFDGYMSEVINADGQQLAPTSFGVANSSGFWSPIIYAGTYGNNGFNLQFENAAALGTDSSPNGNTFTVTNLTSIDQSTDYPKNNFATLNPIDNFYGQNTLSEGNLKMVTSTTTGDDAPSRSTIGVASGKWFWEVKVTSNAGASNIGAMADQETADDQNCGHTQYAWAYKHDGNAANNNQNITSGTSPAFNAATYGNGDIIGVALNLDNNNIIWYKNGAAQNSGTGLAITAAASTPLGFYFAASSDNTENSSTSTHEYNFGSAAYAISSGNADANGYGNFEYAVPSGYYSINTANLAEFG